MRTLNQFHEELPLFLFKTFAALCTHTGHLHKAKTGWWLKVWALQLDSLVQILPPLITPPASSVSSCAEWR